MPNKQTEYSIQALKNLSADTSVSPPIPREGMLGKDANGAWRDVLCNPDGSFAEPLPTIGNNPSLVLGYTGSNLTTVTKTINGVEYQKTLTYTGNNLTGVTAWVEL